MGNENPVKDMKAADFMNHPDAARLFARLDYMLRDGVHLQNNKEQVDYFEFLTENESSLAAYYATFFRLRLEYSGQGSEKYYYLEFNTGEREPVSDAYRHFLKSEHAITGLLLYKLIFIDGNIELDTISKFQSLLRLEYEELRQHLNRLFAKLRSSTNSQTGDDRIDAVITEAMKEFRKLGWLTFFDDDNTFEVQPSFQRLVKLYADKINEVDELIKSYPNS